MNKRQSIIAVISWCLYDWACASYSIVVITFIFATYFTMKIANDPITGTYQWASAFSFSGLIIAISSPLFGAIADYGGHLKKWLFFFTLIAVIFTALLWFAYPQVSAIYFTLTIVIIGTIGYEVAQVFYNAFLPSLAPKNYLGRISGWGWGSGYLGGIVALSIALLFFVQGTSSWLDHDSSAQIRICGPFVALWYGLFSLPLFFFVPNVQSVSLPFTQAIQAGFSELWHTIKKLPKEKNILLYLFAHMIYTDGLNTLFSFGGIYAAGTYGLSLEQVLLFGLTMNTTAGIGAIFLSWMDDYLGSKFTVMFSLVCMAILGFFLLIAQSKFIFWGLALFLAVFIGPVQSASRSLMVRLMHSKQNAAEMFGLYALSGKITAFIGPWVLGVFTLTFASQRAGMSVVLLFFIVGALLMIPIKTPRF